MNSQNERRENGQGQTRSGMEGGGAATLSVWGRRHLAAQRARALAPVRSGRRLIVGFVFLTTAIAAQAQYAIDWFKVAGGGGTSTGGVYSVSGTIGQPDASGPMTNGQFSVIGGFWALPTAVQVTGAPTLTIVPATPGNASISWTPNTPGFVLQQTALLNAPDWTNSPSGATNPIVVPVALPTRFYRLFKP